ncbi:MAG: S-adenosyl-l-methionine hydroxide adenosyltransferase family protein [Gammaproteobacteria bacterium]|nr:S-adenosyl-l-methionine hydroxide adenosyltransferase family protein [Gammaproteobacteria bacterium]
MKKRAPLLAAIALLPAAVAWSADPLVLQSDFGVKDAAVASMKGVAVGVSPDLDIYDLTHEVPAYNIWEASLRLAQAAGYWPEGTVFVSVVDPGVGTERKSVVLQTKSGHYFVSPDNGSLTAVAEQLGVAAVREIDEAVNRLANSEQSYTFHGRDVYAYTGARLAAGVISFEEVGRELPAKVMLIPYEKARAEKRRVFGTIEILDPQFGNIWTNIDRETFKALRLKPGDDAHIVIFNDGELVLTQTLPYYPTFGRVPVGEPLLYLNSLNNVSLAINQGNYSETFDIQSGASWSIRIEK